MLGAVALTDAELAVVALLHFIKDGAGGNPFCSKKRNTCLSAASGANSHIKELCTSLFGKLFPTNNKGGKCYSEKREETMLPIMCKK